MPKLIWHFILGGAVVSLATHFGSKGEGKLAAFITQFPSISVLALFLIYQGGGAPAVGKYVQGFLYVIPPWLLYVFAVWVLCARIGIIPSLACGVGLYFGVSWLLVGLK
ncbi:MAG TPA: DUF3147 domain-containing protein [bacterium]|nr:DUF3147 domain-containing protein [bacterium]HNS48672.1 DUF3147 domain-containing protein [bacterium]